MGQIPLAPPSVKGWDGGPTWINTATLLARFNYVNRLVKTAPPAPKVATMSGGTTMQSPPMQAMQSTMLPAAPAVDLDTFAALTPDTIAQRAGGLDAQSVLAVIARDALQDDLTSDVRATLVDYLNSTNATVPTPLGPENYQEKIRGALALALNLPANQLD
jgi:hypothetical protein